MPTKEQMQEAAEKLRSQVVLSDSEQATLYEQAIDIDFWKNALPGMSVLDDHSLDHFEESAFSSEQLASALAHLERHGYFQMPPLARSDVTARMSVAVEALRNAGWPAIFTYVYDEFWALWRTPSMVRFLSGHFGTGYLQTAGVWTYRVDPQRRASGWPPHVDSRNDAERLSVWTPLTEATIHNGCMYVIPQDRVPPSLPESYLDWNSISLQELSVLLHNVTPLPVRAGSVLGWNNRLIHWGGRAISPDAGLRISVAAEFLHEATQPHRSELPLLDANLPTFRVRLKIIGQAILAYEKFEPLMNRYRGLAAKLIEWAGAANAAS